MARDEKKPTAADKGKGKADNIDGINGDKNPGKTQPDADGKPTTNGKLSDDLPEGTLIHGLLNIATTLTDYDFHRGT